MGGKKNSGGPSGGDAALANTANLNAAGVSQGGLAGSASNMGAAAAAAAASMDPAAFAALFAKNFSGAAASQGAAMFGAAPGATAANFANLWANQVCSHKTHASKLNKLAPNKTHSLTNHTHTHTHFPLPTNNKRRRCSRRISQPLVSLVRLELSARLQQTTRPKYHPPLHPRRWEDTTSTTTRRTRHSAWCPRRVHQASPRSCRSNSVRPRRPTQPTRARSR